MGIRNGHQTKRSAQIRKISTATLYISACQKESFFIGGYQINDLNGNQIHQLHSLSLFDLTTSGIPFLQLLLAAAN